MSAKILIETLEATGLPAAFGFFREETAPPYLVYTGAGQNQFRAENTVYEKNNIYQIEYYFTTKDEDAEEAIEEALLGAGFLYEKSEDVFNEEESVWLIYYTAWRK